MVRKVHKYADGGKVTPPPKQDTKRLKYGTMKGDTYQVDKPKSTVDAMKNTRRKQMEDLGLRNGGKVKRKC